MRATKTQVALVAVCFLVPNLVCQSLRAEISPPPPLKGMGWRQDLPVHLLNDDAVRKDLGLTADLIQKLNDLNSRLKGELQGATGELRRSVQEKFRDQWNELLTPDQRVRFDQLHLQKARLIDALSDTAVIKELGGLTEQQQQSIHAAYKRFHVIQESFPNKLRWNGVRYEPEEFRRIVNDRMKQNEVELTTKLMNVLTPEQQKTFEQLKGQPLEAPKADCPANE